VTDRWKELSLEEHAEHLVLYHPEFVAGSGAREVSPALLALENFVAALPVVDAGEVGVGVAVGVAAVSNGQIYPSEYRPLVEVAVDQVLSPLRHVLLRLVKGEQEGAPPLVVYTATTAAGWVPRIVAVAADGPPVLGAHEGQRVREVVAVLMEGRRPEGVLGGAEYPLEPHWPPEALPQQV
jgi:hypothetical protein